MPKPPERSPRIALSSLSYERRGYIDYEIKRIDMVRGTTNRQAAKILTEEAGRGDWELIRVRRYRNGRRTSWMRRKIIRTRLTI